MKKLVLNAVVLFSSISAIAANPQIRACNVTGGQFMVVNSEFDQFGLCKYGLTTVGSIDILNRDAQIEIPLSLYNYRKGVKACPTQNLTTLTTPEGDSLYVCQYSDSSIIDVETLTSGKDSGRNRQLNMVLGLRN